MDWLYHPRSVSLLGGPMKTLLNDPLFQKNIPTGPQFKRPEVCGPSCVCYRFGPCPRNCVIPKSKEKKEGEK